MLLFIDNYDSFTYNLVHALGEDVTVIRNTIEEALEMEPSRLLIGPGPGNPKNAGISISMVQKFAGKIPILGICLGHQTIGEVFGGEVIRSKLGPVHGKTSPIFHSGAGLFEGVPQGFAATRYHSLVVDRDTLPDCLEVTAETAEGEIMGLRHKEYPIEGVQFHPESVITECGDQLLANFKS